MTHRDTRAHRALKILSIVALSLIAWLIVALILLSWMPPMTRKAETAEVTPLIPFRVHFEDGTSLLTHAPNADTARDQAKAEHPGIIKKTKVDRSGDHG